MGPSSALPLPLPLPLPLSLTDCEQALLQAAAALARETVAPHAARWERERRLGHEALALAAQAGLTRLQVPQDHGGLDLSFACKVQVAEVLAAADFGFTMSWINTHNAAAALARQAAPAVAARYVPDLIGGRRLGCTALTEPGAGSDFAAITTRATRVDGGWQLDGHKAWITNAAEADVVVLYAQTEPGSGARGIASFVVDGRRSGFLRTPAFALGGQHSIGAGGFQLDGYRAADDELLRGPGLAFKAALGSINGARTYIAAMCCGMVAQALHVAGAYGLQRHSFGRALADHQGWRWRLAEAATELQACRLLVADAARRIDAGDSGGGADVQLASAQAKLMATRMAERQLPALAQAMGAEGLREEHPFSRHLMGARVAGFVDGSTEMLLERVAALVRPPV
jgi:alkylation response protein AidB-like acyl-CoA dehydrogenase